MKKLAALLTLFSIGLFAAGCNEAGIDGGPEPIPGESPDMEGGSGTGGTTIDETIDDAPPTTDEIPPLTEPNLDAPPIEPGTEADPAAPGLEDSATDATDSFEPTPAEGETAPQ